MKDVYRCPKCGATDVGVELFYEITRMTCRACSHQRSVDSYELRDDWLATVVLPPGVTESRRGSASRPVR